MMSHLTTMFAIQRDFQSSLGIDPAPDSLDERVALVKDNVLAATDELHEVLHETSWKPWATNKKFNETKVQAELVDVLCFVLNLCLVSGLTADRLFVLYMQKMAVNFKRQELGYADKAKCSVCDLEKGTCEHD